MSQFIEVPKSSGSKIQKKLVFGHGINDAEYITRLKINGKELTCPYYRSWRSVLRRCFSEKYQFAYPTYKNCTVCTEWLTFSNFRKWMEGQDWQEMALDRKIIEPGNEIYSPETCCFVSKELNLLLNNNAAQRGQYPIGVVDSGKTDKEFIARCRVNGKMKYLGCFNTPEEASTVYKKFKSELVIKIAHEQTDQRIKAGLLRHADLIENQE